MKNILRAIPLLLLSLCLFLSGCAQDAETTTGTPDNTPPQSEAPTDPNEIYGIWFSKSANAALEIIQSEQKANFYQILLGCYVYYDLETTTYTYDEGAETLKMTIGDEEYLFNFDKVADILTCEDITYTREATSPTKHAFPDYSAIDCSNILKFPTVDAQKLFQYARADAMREIFTSHYKDSFSGKCPTITDRAAQLGDIVVIDYVGAKDGKPFSGGTASNAEVSISYSSGYIPGFAEGIIGHSVGESFDVPVTFPKNYPNSPDLAGKEVIFTMTLKTIYDVRLSPEQMSSYILPYDTWEEWVDASAHDMLKTIALKFLYSETEFVSDLPNETYLYFYHNYVNQIYSYAAYKNVDPETYVQTYYHVTLEQYKALALDNAKSYAYNYVICHEFAKQEGLTWSAEEYQALFDSYVKKLTDRGYAKEFAENYVNTNQKKQIETELICQVVENWLGESLQSRLGA